MPTAAKVVIRTTLGVVVLAAAAACGGGGGAVPVEGEPEHDLGLVGSGAGGFFYSRDAGTDGSAGESGDGATPVSDAGHRDAGNPNGNGPGSDASSGGNGGEGGGREVGEAGSGVVDAGSGVGVTFSVPPGFFPSLDWVISGPSGYYSGTVYFGQAHSIEFVIGGIAVGSDYTMTIAGTDRYGDSCGGTSSSFDVLPGQVTGAAVVLTCDVPLADASGMPTEIMTGSVGVEAGVSFVDP